MTATGSAGDIRHEPARPHEAPRFVIEHLTPAVDDGRHPLKRILGESCPVAVDILRDGHDVLAGRIVYRDPGDTTWLESPLTYDRNLNDDLVALNGIRRAEPALHVADNVEFHDAGNDALLWYSKRGPEGAATLLIAVNVDPHHAQESLVSVPLALLGVDQTTPFEIEDLLSGEHSTWQSHRAYVRLDRAQRVAQIFRLRHPGAPA